MKKFQRSAAFAAIAFALFFTFGCPARQTISRVNGDPARYRNKEVAIAGRVTDSYGVLGHGAYEIDDGTGRMWVVTERGVPSKGARVGAKGYVQTGFSLTGKNFGTVLVENDRRSQ